MTNIADEFYFLRFIPKEYFFLLMSIYIKMYTCIYSIKNNYSLMSITTNYFLKIILLLIYNIS